MNWMFTSSQLNLFRILLKNLYSFHTEHTSVTANKFVVFMMDQMGYKSWWPILFCLNYLQDKCLLESLPRGNHVFRPRFNVFVPCWTCHMTQSWGAVVALLFPDIMENTVSEKNLNLSWKKHGCSLDEHIKIAWAWESGRVGIVCPCLPKATRVHWRTEKKWQTR